MLVTNDDMILQRRKNCENLLRFELVVKFILTDQCPASLLVCFSAAEEKRNCQQRL